MNVIETIKHERIIAILRGDYRKAVPALTEALIMGGIKIIEMTLNSPGAIDGIRCMSEQFGDQLLVGAGTVLEPDQAKQAVDAGAKFIVSPETNPAVIETALDLGVVPVPGAFTPTEIMQAYRAGARLIKLFPAIHGGPNYLKLIRGPLDHIEFVVTGGIDASNARLFLSAGAAAVGVGGVLVPAHFDGSPAAAADVTTHTRSFVASIPKV
jgi:2-dehydro-3-deoxyphosphogluconate aldolase / (4S)-4-hydroxy-2-oxoglutarate aldolase